ncbi:MAG: nucleotide pyrophosphatase/phosphodiesterase family protein [Planctomycetota bacterium]
MPRTLVLNIVGLSKNLIGPHTPRLRAFADEHGCAFIDAALPAVTCTAQTNYLTGKLPREHGIVGNGWYFRETAEVRLWQQADALVQTPRLWDELKSHGKTTANLFWWYAMYCGADAAVTPRPMYPADGRKVPDVWTHPPVLRDALQQQLGRFPLFKFWGPMAGIESTRWIAETVSRVPADLQLVYLPHLDYGLQKFGPDAPEIAEELQAVDAVVGRLLDEVGDAHVVMLSEYGIEAVDQPVHLNRVLRGAGLLAVREELGTERLDCGASRAFAVADHQVAHIYVRDVSNVATVRAMIEGVPGVERVLGEDEKRAAGLDHERSGELVAVAKPGAWFTYYFWMQDERAPDYTRTVDIHRKPGYDPVELFTDRSKAAIAWKLLKKKAGLRSLLDVIPLDASLVRGSHGRPPTSPEQGPILMSSRPELLPDSKLASTDVYNVLRKHVLV